jgi:hypothetical protein
MGQTFHYFDIHVEDRQTQQAQDYNTRIYLASGGGMVQSRMSHPAFVRESVSDPILNDNHIFNLGIAATRLLLKQDVAIEQADSGYKFKRMDTIMSFSVCNDKGDDYNRVLHMRNNDVQERDRWGTLSATKQFSLTSPELLNAYQDKMPVQTAFAINDDQMTVVFNSQDGTVELTGQRYHCVLRRDPQKTMNCNQ